MVLAVPTAAPVAGLVVRPVLAAWAVLEVRPVLVAGAVLVALVPQVVPELQLAKSNQPSVSAPPRQPEAVVPLLRVSPEVPLLKEQLAR